MTSYSETEQKSKIICNAYVDLFLSRLQEVRSQLIAAPECACSVGIPCYPPSTRRKDEFSRFIGFMNRV